MNKKIWVWVAAILLAVFLWLQSVLLSDQEQSLQIPIIFDPQPQDLILSGQHEPFVEVNLKAKGVNIFIFKNQNIYYKIDGRKVKYGKNSLHLTPANLSCSQKQLEYVEGFSQKARIIEMDRITSRKKPVVLTFDSEEDERFYLAQKLDVSSNIVQVKGPEKMLETLDYIKTEPVNKHDLKNNQLKVSLTSPSNLIELQNQNIVIEFNSLSKTIKTIPLINVSYNGEQHIDFSPQRVTVKIEGAQLQVNNISKKDITAMLILPENQISGDAQLIFELPEGIKLLQYTPEKIRFNIKENE